MNGDVVTVTLLEIWQLAIFCYVYLPDLWATIGEVDVNDWVSIYLLENQIGTESMFDFADNYSYRIMSNVR